MKEDRMNEITQNDLNTEYLRVAARVTNICILCNVLLCILKMAGGLIAGSKALISDGINSAFDVVSGVIVIVGTRIAGKNPDKEHPYGHERFESVAAVVLAVILFVTGVFVGHTAIEGLVSGSYRTAEYPESCPSWRRCCPWPSRRSCSAIHGPRPNGSAPSL